MFIPILCSFLFFSYLNSIIKNNIFLYLDATILVLIAGLRNITVGNDTVVYYMNYIGNNTMYSANRQFEFGFSFLEHIFQFIQAPYWLFFLFISFITFFLLTSSFKDYSSLPAFALTYYYSRYFILRDFNQIRSSLASAIILFSLRYIKRKNFFTFLLLILLAGSIHQVGYLGIIIYPIYWLLKKYALYIKKQKYLITYILILVISSVASILLNPLIANSGLAYSMGDASQTLTNPVIIYQILISIVAIWCYSHNSVRDKYISVLLVSYAIATILLVLFRQYSTIAGRTSTIFATVEPLIIIYILRNFFSKKVSTIIFTIIIIGIFWLINCNTGLLQNIQYSFSI